MSSLDSILVKQGIAQNKVGTVVDDGPVALRLKYLGTGTITSVTVDTGTDLEMITSDGGTETFAFATYTTIATLADAINASAYWEALVLDALRTDQTNNSDFVDGVITVSSAGFYDVTVDTSVAQNAGGDFIYTYRCAYNREPGSEKPSGSHRVRLSEVKYSVNVNGIEAKGFQIFEWDAKAKTETAIYQVASVATTATTVNFASGNKTLDAGIGNDLIVRVKDTTSIGDAAGNYLISSYTRE